MTTAIGVPLPRINESTKFLDFVQHGLQSLRHKLSKIMAMYQGPRRVEVNRLAFLNCVIRVNLSESRRQKFVSQILESSRGISHFRNEDGVMEICGRVNPEVLLKTIKKGGKKIELLWLEFGGCPSILNGPRIEDFMEDRPQTTDANSHA